MKTEIKRQYQEQISDMFQTVADFSDTPLKDWWIDGWSEIEATIGDKCYVSKFRIKRFKKIETKTVVLELLYVDGVRRWFPTHEQINLKKMILELLVERFNDLQP